MGLKGDRHARGQPNALHPIFQYTTIENFKTSLANNSSTIDPNALKSNREVQKTFCRSCQNLRPIVPNLHNDFDKAICKPSTGGKKN